MSSQRTRMVERLLLVAAAALGITAVVLVSVMTRNVIADSPARNVDMLGAWMHAAPPAWQTGSQKSGGSVAAAAHERGRTAYVTRVSHLGAPATVVAAAPEPIRPIFARIADAFAELAASVAPGSAGATQGHVALHLPSQPRPRNTELLAREATPSIAVVSAPVSTPAAIPSPPRKAAHPVRPSAGRAPAPRERARSVALAVSRNVEPAGVQIANEPAARHPASTQAQGAPAHIYLPEPSGAAAPASAAPPPEVVAAAPIAHTEEDARMVRAAEPIVSDPRGVEEAATAVVDVTISPSGKVSAVHLERSTGQFALDQAALSAARQSAYAPAKFDGKPTSATYRAIYDFKPL